MWEWEDHNVLFFSQLSLVFLPYSLSFVSYQYFYYLVCCFLFSLFLLLFLIFLVSISKIIIIIIIIIISFMQCIYTYIPHTNHVSRQYSVAAFLLLLFMVHITLFAMSNVLYFYIITFRNLL